MTERMTTVPHRPALRWHGGKWRLAPWIIEQMPEHVVYTEPFGGAASVLLQKPRSKVEVYNDLDGDVVNLFRVLRGPRSAELIDRIRWTPFARAEFEVAYAAHEDEVQRAWALVVRSFMGFGSNGHARRTGFRAKGYRAGALPQHDWIGLPDALRAVADRMRGVVIEDGRGYSRPPPVSEEVAGTLETVKPWNVATRWTVRRLTPVECERLQGFPDGYTDVPYGRRNRTPDGPRYKGLGNSMAVNAMEWIGQRIAFVEGLK